MPFSDRPWYVRLFDFEAWSGAWAIAWAAYLWAVPEDLAAWPTLRGLTGMPDWAWETWLAGAGALQLYGLFWRCRCCRLVAAVLISVFGGAAVLAAATAPVAPGPAIMCYAILVWAPNAFVAAYMASQLVRWLADR